MKYITLYVTLIALFCANTNAQKASKNSVIYDPLKKYTVEELHMDLVLLKDALLKIHPGLFWYQSEQEFEAKYSSLKNSINKPMTELEFYNALMPFIASVKCSHTGLTLSNSFDSYFTKTQKFFPFSVRIIASKIYLLRNYTSDTMIKIGSEITAINGISADSILRFMEPYAWADGFAKSAAMIEGDFEAFFAFYYYSDKYVINTIQPNGDARRIDADAVDSKTYNERFKKNYDSTHVKHYKPFKLRIIDSLSTAVIRIDVFEGKGYHKFLSRSFKTIKSKEIRNLIIDVRGNGGGEDHYGKILFSYFAAKKFKYYDRMEVQVSDLKDSIFKYVKMPMGKLRLKLFYAFNLKKTEEGKYIFKNKAHENLSDKPFKPYKKNNFAGKVYVLIDEDSFSATSEFCSAVQFAKRSTFIGRETGGGYCGNSSGADGELTLPKTKIRIYIPLIKYCMAVEGSCGSGIKPDHFLKEDIRDVVLDKDSDMLFTLDLIRSSK